MTLFEGGLGGMAFSEESMSVEVEFESKRPLPTPNLNVLLPAWGSRGDLSECFSWCFPTVRDFPPSGIVSQAKPVFYKLTWTPCLITATDY